MLSLGIDISTYTGLVKLDGQGKATPRLLHFPQKTGWKRLQLLATGVDSFLAEGPLPSVVCVEGYAQGGHRNVDSFILSVEIGTLIRQVLANHRLSWYTVPATVLKKFATGKGTAKKPQVGAAVAEKWGFTSKSDDVVDAYVLARIGREIENTGVVPDQLKGIIHHGLNIV